MSSMLRPIAPSVRNFADNGDEVDIVGAINAETQASTEADYDSWAACWVHEERAQSVSMSSTTGLNVISGWSNIAADMAHVFGHGLSCGMRQFRQDNFHISVGGQTGWAVFDQWAQDEDGATWETFETRILERSDQGWKIVYSSFVEKRSDLTLKDVVIVDNDGHVLWSGRETLEKLPSHPYLTVSAGRIRARRPHWDRVLQSAIARAGRYHSFSEHRRFAANTGGAFRYPAVLGETDEGGVAVIHVAVQDGETCLHIDGNASLDRRLAVSQAVFGLSDGQVKMARQITSGVGLKAAAQELGISVNTARTHLSRLYDKTGVASQTALVRLLLSVG